MILASCGNPHGDESSALIGANDTSTPDTSSVSTRVVIETAAGGSGSEVTTDTLTDGEAINLFAVRRDSNDTFIENVSVTWSVSDTSLGDLSASTGTSTTYTPTQNAGSVIFTASEALGGSDTTGTITLEYTPQNYSGLELWLKADSLSASDNDLIDTWSDLSGQGHDATQTGSNRATYIENQINGLPVIRFDGVDDYYDDSHSYNSRTVFVVYRVSSVSQDTNDLGQLWGEYAAGVHVACDARGGGNSQGFSFDGSGGSGGIYSLDNNAFSGVVTNSNTQAWVYDQTHLVTTQFTATTAISQQVIGNLFPSFPVGNHQFGGDIAEIIVYSTDLSSAEIDAIKTYLNTKYSVY